MDFSRIFLNRLQNEPEAHETVVVIDVLRSFTTAAYALAAGAPAVYPVATLGAALQRAADLPRAVTAGAIAGGDPLPAFDYGNSPSALHGADFRDCPLVLHTAAGVRGLQRYHQARHLFAGSLVCARATAAEILRLQARQVTFIITGEWVDRDGDEDIACADYIQALLQGQEPNPAIFEERVRQSDFGKRFLRQDNPSLPLDDLKLCAQADHFSFAMPVHTKNGRQVIVNPAVKEQA